ncbi:MAG TPA: potassium transporter TrkG [Polyangiales bacterium]|nr:potassium transporter TrkG [Polyangiales bacterium]
MTPDAAPLAAAATERLRVAKARLAALVVLSRSTLAFAFAAVTGLDFGTLREGSLMRPITLVQSVLLLFTAYLAAKRERAELTSGVRERWLRSLAYLSSSLCLAALVLVQKWWIVLRPDLTSQLNYSGSYKVMSFTIALIGVLLALERGQRFSRYFAAFAAHPARQTALSFVVLAMFGAFILTFPVCNRQPQHVSFLDALFMATSAVCVTGLAVHVISEQYTAFGQSVLLMLVQVGGLGIMVLSASLVVLTGRKLRARNTAALAEMIDAESLASLHGNIIRIVMFTLGCEALGALLLYWSFENHPEVALGFESSHPMAGAGSFAWAAIFQAVSAFCNAGFTLSRDNMLPFVDSYDICTITMLLITLGGLGFPVLSELAHWLATRARRQRPQRLSLHTRTVVSVSVGLVVATTLLFAAVEWRHSLQGQPWHVKLLASLFQSVALRTAGFNTIDFGAASAAGLMVSIMVMFVGASPGGTGGGIKTTTFAVLLATFRAELRGSSDPWLFDRRLPAATVKRAIAVSFVAAAVLTCTVFAMLLCEDAEPLRVVFEAVSAFATVGFSASLTPILSSPGKLLIIVTMLIGRIGPLTVALAASERAERSHHLPPQERVLIG